MGLPPRGKRGQGVLASPEPAQKRAKAPSKKVDVSKSGPVGLALKDFKGLSDETLEALSSGLADCLAKPAAGERPPSQLRIIEEVRGALRTIEAGMRNAHQEAMQSITTFDAKEREQDEIVAGATGAQEEACKALAEKEEKQATSLAAWKDAKAAAAAAEVKLQQRDAELGRAAMERELLLAVQAEVEGIESCRDDAKLQKLFSQARAVFPGSVMLLAALEEPSGRIRAKGELSTRIAGLGTSIASGALARVDLALATKSLHEFLSCSDKERLANGAALREAKVSQQTCESAAKAAAKASRQLVAERKKASKAADALQDRLAAFRAGPLMAFEDLVTDGPAASTASTATTTTPPVASSSSASAAAAPGTHAPEAPKESKELSFKEKRRRRCSWLPRHVLSVRAAREALPASGTAREADKGEKCIDVQPRENVAGPNVPAAASGTGPGYPVGKKVEEEVAEKKDSDAHATYEALQEQKGAFNIDTDHTGILDVKAKAADSEKTTAAMQPATAAQACVEAVLDDDESDEEDSVAKVGGGSVRAVDISMTVEKQAMDCSGKGFSPDVDADFARLPTPGRSQASL